MKIIGTTLNAKYIHTNLALRFLKAYVEPAYPFEIVEFTIKDPILHIVSDLFSRNPDVIGFSCYIWNIEETKKVAELLKKVKPDCKIILGGPEVSYNPIFWLETIPEIDAIVVGEGEATFKEILDAIATGKTFEAVTGLAYRSEEQIIQTLPRKKIDLNTIGSPYRFEEDLPTLPNRIAYFETSRGCPFNCQFCLSSIEIGVRYFDREQAKADLLYLIENGVKTIKFMDRTFNISRSYAMDIFAFLIEHHRPGMSIQFEITADIMRPEVIEYLNKNAPPGLFRFEIGVQSTNDNTNLLVERKQNFEKLARIVTMIKEGGKIDQHLDLIAGLPGEDYNSFRKTFNDVFALRPEELQLGFLKMLHGTGLTRDAKKYGYQYMAYPPYEIVSNRIMPFGDVIRIKQVEDVLEKYWNDHRMDLTVEYLVRHVYKSPFDFFQAFGAYWELQGWSRIGHQLADLFKRLSEFIQATEPSHHEVLLSLMKYDFLTRQTYKPRSLWWEEQLSVKERLALFKHLRNKEVYFSDHQNVQNRMCNEVVEDVLAMTDKEILKHAYIEQLTLDIGQFEMANQVIVSDSYLLVFFDPKTRVTAYKCFKLAIN